MKPLRLCNLAFALGALLFISGTRADARDLSLLVSDRAPSVISESFDTGSFREIENKVLTLAAQLGHDQVLVVYDIDSTLLATDQPLGSDAWFSWQFEELTKPRPNDAVAPDPVSMLEVSSRVLALTHQRPTEAVVPEIIRNLQDQAITSIILTARADRYRSTTELQLKTNGFDFTLRPLGDDSGFAGTYIPWNLSRPETSGLTNDLGLSLGLKAAQPVSYMNGIIMGNDLHKGAVLRTLLHKVGRQFKVIVFVDDQPKNVQAMQAAFAGSDTAVITFRYGHEDARVRAFRESDKKDVKAAWRQLKAVMDRYF